MSFSTTLRQHGGKLAIFGAVCALAGLAGGAWAAGKKSMVIVPIEGARFVPTDPAQPDGSAFAVLRGDPEKGPSVMLLRFTKGTRGELHTHSSDYDLVMVKGTMKHWGQGEDEATAKPLGPGSYWFQPGNHAHGGACLTDECLMFVSWAGKRDGKVVGPPKK